MRGGGGGRGGMSERCSFMGNELNYEPCLTTLTRMIMNRGKWCGEEGSEWNGCRGVKVLRCGSVSDVARNCHEWRSIKEGNTARRLGK